jgi:hypothetical protein
VSWWAVALTRLHASHHRRTDDGAWELNDWFPVVHTSCTNPYAKP